MISKMRLPYSTTVTVTTADGDKLHIVSFGDGAATLTFKLANPNDRSQLVQLSPDDAYVVQRALAYGHTTVDYDLDLLSAPEAVTSASYLVQTNDEFGFSDRWDDDTEALEIAQSRSIGLPCTVDVFSQSGAGGLELVASFLDGRQIRGGV